MAEDFPFRYVPPVDPNLGRRVDHYFILRTLLGRGGMGAVYLAEHEALRDTKCVVKLVLAELARQPMGINRYKTETEAVSRLKHDNIVKLQNFGVLEDGQLFMRFEYVEGKSLQRYVAERGGRLSLRDAAYFIFQLCDAMQYAHESGVIHRDLKPDNLMIEDRPRGSHLTERVKILDFGIAKVIASTSEHTASGVSMGTPRFMAPEQVTNAAAATAHADVFSLAVIFYLLVTGTLPWGTPESDIAIYHKQQTERPVRPAEHVMPSEVSDVVLGALSLVPAHRPTMRDFAIDLACAIPAEEGLPSGTEILIDVNRSWVTSSLPRAQTFPYRAAVPAVGALPPLALPVEVAHVDGEGRAARPRGDTSPPRVAEVHPAALPATPDRPPGEHHPTPPLHGVTANERPSALAASAAGAHVSTPVQHTPVPILAGLPTGLISQRFAAQESPAEMRALPVAVASEIEMASGTPGPQPYAHAELPAIVVSTQLSAAPHQERDPGAPALAGVEPAPIWSVPVVARARRGRRTLLLGGLALAATGAVALFMAMPQRTPKNRHDASPFVVPAASNGPPPRAVVVLDPVAGPAAEASRPPLPAEVVASPPPAGSGSSPVSGSADVAHAPTAGVSHPPRSPDASSAAQVASPHVEDKARAPSPEAQGSSRPLAASAIAAKENGELAVLVRPWAAIWLNGKPVPDGTPYRAQVPAGRYHIRIANDDLARNETITVVVSAHKTTIVERKW